MSKAFIVAPQKKKQWWLTNKKVEFLLSFCNFFVFSALVLYGFGVCCRVKLLGFFNLVG
jgi:hypothetical protein